MPARSSRKSPSKSASKKAAKPAKTAKRTAKAPKASKAAKASAKSPGPRPAPKGKATPATGREGRIGCAATDPFGGPCQNTPRLGSKYCGVHSHLEAMA